MRGMFSPLGCQLNVSQLLLLSVDLFMCKKRSDIKTNNTTQFQKENFDLTFFQVCCFLSNQF